MNPLVILAISLALILFVVLYRTANRNLPPGPRGLPFLGYYPFLSREPAKDFARLAQKYGNVFSFRTVGGYLIVVLNGSDAIKDAVINHADVFTCRPTSNNLVWWVSDGIGIAQEEGEAWKEHRQFFQRAMQGLGVGTASSDQVIHEEVGNLLEDIRKMGAMPRNLTFDFQNLTCNIVSRILFSRRFEKDGRTFEQLYEGAKYVVDQFVDERYMIVGLPFWIMMEFFPSMAGARKGKTFYRNLFEEMIEEHVQTLNPDSPKDLIDLMLCEAYKLEKRGEKDHFYTKEKMAGICLNLLIEGTESTSSSIIGLLDIAAQYPEEQKWVQAQLDAVVKRGGLVSWSDKPDLPYLDAYIEELFRHKLPFNLSSAYSNIRETTFRGYRIPKRTTILSNYYSVVPEVVDDFPDATRFNPKRFLDESGRVKKTDGPYPFGVGKRTCAAMSLGKRAVFIIIGSVFKNFTIYPTGESGRYRVEPR